MQDSQEQIKHQSQEQIKHNIENNQIEVQPKKAIKNILQDKDNMINYLMSQIKDLKEKNAKLWSYKIQTIVTHLECLKHSINTTIDSVLYTRYISTAYNNSHNAIEGSIKKLDTVLNKDETNKILRPNYYFNMSKESREYRLAAKEIFEELDQHYQAEKMGYIHQDNSIECLELQKYLTQNGLPELYEKLQQIADNFIVAIKNSQDDNDMEGIITQRNNKLQQFYNNEWPVFKIKNYNIIQTFINSMKNHNDNAIKRINSLDTPNITNITALNRKKLVHKKLAHALADNNMILDNIFNQWSISAKNSDTDLITLINQNIENLEKISGIQSLSCQQNVVTHEQHQTQHNTILGKRSHPSNDQYQIFENMNKRPNIMAIESFEEQSQESVRLLEGVQQPQMQIQLKPHPLVQFINQSQGVENLQQIQQSQSEFIGWRSFVNQANIKKDQNQDINGKGL